MATYIDEVSEKVGLEEGGRVVEQLLIECYVKPGISTKELARKTMLPIPVATAIKKELIKLNILQQDRGVRCTLKGNDYVENEWGFKGLDKRLYQQLISDDVDWKLLLADLLHQLRDIFTSRPQVDVRIDQSKCTPETSMHRAILCLKDHALIAKQVLCVGDDDLVSVSLALLLKRLFPASVPQKTKIDVIDIDQRFLHYISKIAEQERLSISCCHLDLKRPLPQELHKKYDCFFTDPPYTLPGMSLFVSRGISALKKRKGLPIYLSFAHKSPDATLEIQQALVRMGITVKEIIPNFNEYEGAQMIANKSQMMILRTTEKSSPAITTSYEDALYTGELRQTLRTYRCKKCAETVLIGQHGVYTRIEELKQRGCPYCQHETFELISRFIDERE